MRSATTLTWACAALLLTAPTATASPSHPEATATLLYDFGRCDTTTLHLPSGVPVRLEVTARNQFDPAAYIRIPDFLWQRQLPQTIAPQTISVDFTVARPGTFTFSVIPSAATSSVSTGCQGTLVIH